jgi:hypothetical protein
MRRLLAATVIGIGIGGSIGTLADADPLPQLPAPPEPSTAPPPATSAAPAPESPPAPTPTAAPAPVAAPTPAPATELAPTRVTLGSVPHFFTFSIGIGFSGADGRHDTTAANGLYLAAEYWAKLYPWLNLRTYLGALGTGTNQTYCHTTGDCDVSQDVALVGAKVRLVAPIPWIAPFFEAGLGLSIGVIHATDLDVDRVTEGVAYHVPFGFGLSIGPKHNVDLAFDYMILPGARAVAGGLVAGLTLPAP